MSELCSFREYLDQRIAGGEVELTPENALRDWREMQDSLQSIRRGIADADAGRIRTAESLLDELQTRLVRR
jgi:predicted transcriptional regulator